MNYINSSSYSISDDVKERLKISFDGTIMAVDPSFIGDELSTDESKMIRLGMRQPPRRMKIICDETFKKFLSYQAYCD